MKLWGMVLAVCGVLLTGVQVYAAPVADHVVINEIMANPANGEIEWIELYNPTDTTFDMTGWRLSINEKDGNFSNIFGADTIIVPRGYVVRLKTSAALNNASATITLKDKALTTIDQVTYAGITQAKTYARTCDASDTWVAQAEPTQGGANCTATPPPTADTTPPSIDEIAGGEIRQQFSLAIAAHDETSTVVVVATLTQYGSEVARCEGAGGCTLGFDSTTVPNGSAELKITAKDAAGNRTDKTVAYTIANALPTQPPKSEPTAQPVISMPTPATSEILPAVEDTPGRGATLPTLQTIAVTKSIASISVPTSKAQLAIAAVAKPAIPRTTATAAPANITAMQNNETEISATLPVEAAKESAKTTPAVLPKVPWQGPAIAVLIGSFVVVTMWRWRRRDKT